jgi:hypothetical protein
VRQAFSVLVALLLAVMLCASAKAQTTTGAVYGTVVDTSGAVVPNASITVTNVQTGTKKTVQTNAGGDYIFLVLDPGELAQPSG